MSTTTALALVTGAVTDFGAGVLAVLTATIVLGVGYLVFRFGWRKTRGARGGEKLRALVRDALRVSGTMRGASLMENTATSAVGARPAGRACASPAGRVLTRAWLIAVICSVGVAHGLTAYAEYVPPHYHDTWEFDTAGYQMCYWQDENGDEWVSRATYPTGGYYDFHPNYGIKGGTVEKWNGSNWAYVSGFGVIDDTDPLEDNALCDHDLLASYPGFLWRGDSYAFDDVVMEANYSGTTTEESMTLTLYGYDGVATSTICTTTAEDDTTVCGSETIFETITAEFTGVLATSSDGVEVRVTDSLFTILESSRWYFDSPGSVEDSLLYDPPSASSSARYAACIVPDGAFLDFISDPYCAHIWFGNGIATSTLQSGLEEQNLIGWSPTQYNNECSDIGITDVFLGIKCAGLFLFIPSPATLERLSDITLEGKFPFQYLYDIGDVRQQLFAVGDESVGKVSVPIDFGNGTSTFTFISSEMVENVPYSDTFRTLIGWAAWIMFGTYLYRRVLTMHDTQTV
jgi:hypothetical protein